MQDDFNLLVNGLNSFPKVQYNQFHTCPLFWAYRTQYDILRGVFHVHCTKASLTISIESIAFILWKKKKKKNIFTTTTIIAFNVVAI